MPFGKKKIPTLRAILILIASCSECKTHFNLNLFSKQVKQMRSIIITNVQDQTEYYMYYMYISIQNIS